jgi:hypothetical protein
MAKFVLTAGYVAINAGDLSSYCSSIQLQIEAESKETTTFGSSGWHEEISGIKSATLALVFKQDVAAAALDSHHVGAVRHGGDLRSPGDIVGGVHVEPEVHGQHQRQGVEPGLRWRRRPGRGQRDVPDHRHGHPRHGLTMADTWSVTADDLRDVGTALKYEEDGARLRRALTKELRTAVAPAVAEAKGRVMAMGTAGLPHAGEPLRAAVARRVTAQARLTGRSAGVRVRASKKGMPRGFANAPKRLNAAGGWRHPVFGDADRWVDQTGAPGWFDDPLRARRAEYRQAVERAVKDMADRIRGAA